MRFSLKGHMFLRIYSFFLSFPIFWHIMVHNSPYQPFNFWSIHHSVSSFISDFIYLHLLSFFPLGDSPGKNTGVGCHALLQGIFPTQGLNPGLPHCRQILYRLSHQGSLLISYTPVQNKSFKKKTHCLALLLCPQLIGKYSFLFSIHSYCVLKCSS